MDSSPDHTSGHGGGDASSAPDARAYQNPGIACGGGECDPANEVCCFDSALTGKQSCQSATAAPTVCKSDTIIACDDFHDCEAAGLLGMVCCGVAENAQLPLLESTCVAMADCFTGTKGSVVTILPCDPKSPDPCANGSQCEPVMGYAAYQCMGP
jgi:hypothetical protein